MPQGVQGPLATDQIRPTATNQMRKPAYVYDENSNKFNQAPEGVEDPIRQVREVNRFRGSDRPSGNWYQDEAGKWQRWVDPQAPAKQPRPTAAQEKERLAIEAATAQLKAKQAVRKIGTMQTFEPITTLEQAQAVPVSLGLDMERYPEIKKLVQSYDVPPAPEEPKQRGLWDEVKDFGRGAAGAVANAGRALGSAAQRAAQPRPAAPQAQETAPVQPRKQQASKPLKAKNPKTGQRIVSYDGGKTWEPMK
jgi:hypothetical protein